MSKKEKDKSINDDGNLDNSLENYIGSILSLLVNYSPELAKTCEGGVRVAVIPMSALTGAMQIEEQVEAKEEVEAEDEDKKNSEMKLKFTCILLEKLMGEKRKAYEELAEIEYNYGADSPEYTEKKEALRKLYNEFKEKLDILRGNLDAPVDVLKSANIQQDTYKTLITDLLVSDWEYAPDDHLSYGVFELLQARSFFVTISEESETIEDESIKKTYLNRKYEILQDYPRLEGWFFGEEFLGINNASEEYYPDDKVMGYLRLSQEEYEDTRNGYGITSILEAAETYTKFRERVNPAEQKLIDATLLVSLKFIDDEHMNEALNLCVDAAKSEGLSFTRRKIKTIIDKAKTAKAARSEEE